MNHLLNLPASCLVDILCTWCENEVEILMRLDCSFSNKQFRNRFLEIIASPSFVVQQIWGFHQLVYAARRGIRMVKIIVVYPTDNQYDEENDFPNYESMFLSLNSSELTAISFGPENFDDKFYDCFVTFLNSCPTLTSFELNFDARVDYFLQLSSTFLGNLIEFQSYQNPLTNEIVEHMAEHCHSLTELNINKCCCQVSEESIGKLLKNNSNLNVLGLFSSTSMPVTHITIQNILKFCLKLHSLTLTLDWGDDSQIVIAQVIRFLTNMNLSNLLIQKEVGSCFSLITYVGNYKIVKIADFTSSNIVGTVADYQWLFTVLAGINELELDFYSPRHVLTEETLPLITRNNPGLNSLKLSRVNIATQDIIVLLAHCPMLKSLSVSCVRSMDGTSSFVDKETLQAYILQNGLDIKFELLFVE